MQEIWLRTNRRLLLVGMILPAVLVAVGLIVACAMPGNGAWLRGIGWALLGVGALMFVVLLLQLRTPRLGYSSGELFVFLRAGRPFPVPVEFVECFFLGSGAGQLPGSTGQEVAVRNLVLRLSEKAIDYHHRNVKPALGHWDDGYITIHGAWCEPLNLEVVKRLNAQLAEAQRART